MFLDLKLLFSSFIFKQLHPFRGLNVTKVDLLSLFYVSGIIKYYGLLW
jgi:hypothetical protein